MKTKSLHLLFITLLFLITISCEDDNDHKRNKVISLIEDADFYLFKNGKDSIILDSSYFTLSYHFYKKDEKGIYTRKDVHCFTKDDLEFKKDNDGKFFTDGSKKLYYDTNGDILLLLHLSELGTVELHPTISNFKIIPEPELNGIWCEITKLDSTILVFENNKLKQYVFLRNTKEMIASLYSSSYWTWKTYYYWKKEVFTSPTSYLEYQNPDSTSYHKESATYKLFNDSLSISSDISLLRGGDFKRVK